VAGSNPCLDPAVLPEAAPFWAAANEDRLVVRTCNNCGRGHHYPRSICPHCHSVDLRWQATDGRGRIYSYTVVTVPNGAPYVLAYVEIADRVCAMTHIVDCDLATLAIGQPVRAVFRPASNGQKVLSFTPI